MAEQESQKTIVLVTGGFDPIHSGHINISKPLKLSETHWLLVSTVMLG